MHIYKFKKALEDDSLAVTITAKDLLDASRYMQLLRQLEPSGYGAIDLDCVRVLDVERISYREDRVVHFVHPYPKYILENEKICASFCIDCDCSSGKRHYG